MTETPLETPLDFPENYLWVRYERTAAPGEPRGTVLSVERLYGLLANDSPRDHTEELLAAAPQWIRTYLASCHGNYVIEIPQHGPLPIFMDEDQT